MNELRKLGKTLFPEFWGCEKCGLVFHIKEACDKHEKKCKGKF